MVHQAARKSSGNSGSDGLGGGGGKQSSLSGSESDALEFGSNSGCGGAPPSLHLLNSQAVDGLMPNPYSPTGGDAGGGRGDQNSNRMLADDELAKRQRSFTQRFKDKIRRSYRRVKRKKNKSSSKNRESGKFEGSDQGD